MISISLIFVVFFVAISNGLHINDENVLRFIGLGDWGKGGNDGNILETSSAGASAVHEDDDSGARTAADNKQYYTYQAPIAKAMADWADAVTPQPSFVLALGDNFYTEGVASTTDSLWQTLWEQVYLTNYPSLNIPWYPVFGNHDYGYGQTGVNAQIDRYKEDVDGLWQFPATNYSRTFPLPDGGTLAIVFVDTTTLAPSMNKCCNQNGGISVDVQTERIENQLLHLDRMLYEVSAQQPSWLFVSGHYPIFSEGDHGDTSELMSYLLPLLKQYKVHAYICGHDHISEHLQEDDIEYFVSGAGAMTDNLGQGDLSKGKLLWSGTGYSAFSTFTVSSEKIDVSYIDHNGEVVYEYQMINPNPPPPVHKDKDDKDTLTSNNDFDSYPNIFFLNPSREQALIFLGVAGVVAVLTLVVLGISLRYRNVRKVKKYIPKTSAKIGVERSWSWSSFSRGHASASADSSDLDPGSITTAKAHLSNPVSYREKNGSIYTGSTGQVNSIDESGRSVCEDDGLVAGASESGPGKFNFRVAIQTPGESPLNSLISSITSFSSITSGVKNPIHNDNKTFFDHRRSRSAI